MTSNNINIGIVGLGFMAAMHIRAYRQIDTVTVAAILYLGLLPSRVIDLATASISTIF